MADINSQASEFQGLSGDSQGACVDEGLFLGRSSPPAHQSSEGDTSAMRNPEERAVDVPGDDQETVTGRSAKARRRTQSALAIDSDSKVARLTNTDKWLVLNPATLNARDTVLFSNLAAIADSIDEIHRAIIIGGPTGSRQDSRSRRTSMASSAEGESTNLSTTQITSLVDKNEEMFITCLDEHVKAGGKILTTRTSQTLPAQAETWFTLVEAMIGEGENVDADTTTDLGVVTLIDQHALFMETSKRKKAQVKEAKDKSEGKSKAKATMEKDVDDVETPITTRGRAGRRARPISLHSNDSGSDTPRAAEASTRGRSGKGRGGAGNESPGTESSRRSLRSGGRESMSQEL